MNTQNNANQAKPSPLVGVSQAQITVASLQSKILEMERKFTAEILALQTTVGSIQEDCKQLKLAVSSAKTQLNGF